MKMNNSRKMTNSKHLIQEPTENTTTRSRIKYIIRLMIAKIYKIYLDKCQVEIKEKKYRVSVCAIFKNEANYLEEWIEFNHIIGIDHSHLYLLLFPK